MWSTARGTQPHPPILLGSGPALARKRVVGRYDGSIPIGISTEQLAAEVADLRKLARERGRDPEGIRWRSCDLCYEEAI
jgi:alkanesulfonate monooxygenase SsuD/methylene tetrahydromethanopterin reductase-like flavin-dependent oxidoreductase (luciferase family)